MLEISGVALSLDSFLPGAEQAQIEEAASVLGVLPAHIAEFSIVRKSVDARKKKNVHFTTTVQVQLPAEQEARLLAHAPKGCVVREYVPYAPLEYPCITARSTVPPAVAGGKSTMPPAAAVALPTTPPAASAASPTTLSSAPAAPSTTPPIVVGAGPAGLFAALYLARCGLCPVLIEQGQSVQERAKSVEAFNATGMLNAYSNIQFGEGGAGTFSDGKLTTNIKNPYTRHVLHAFVQAGAPESILQEAHPHLGSDNLPRIVKTLREEIIARGGEVLFNTKLVNWEFETAAPIGECAASVSACELKPTALADAKLASVELENVETGVREVRPARQLILACGHSARDVFELCYKTGLSIEQKPFSLGVRIEHEQAAINKAQWGTFAHHAALGAAEYKLAVHLPSGASVYTFCMCPGGEVVAAASEAGGIVTNGMSSYARAGANANAALLVGVSPSQFGSSHVLAGVELQRSIERAAFELSRRCGGVAYQAPAQRAGAFLRDCAAIHTSGTSAVADVRDVAGTSAMGANMSAGSSNAAALGAAAFPVYSAKNPVQPTYARGVVEAPLVDCLPEFVSQALAEALPLLGRKLKGFDNPDALLTAPETRSSSPVRICRNKETLQAYFIGGKAGVGMVSGGVAGADVVPAAAAAVSRITEPASAPVATPAPATGIYPCGEGPGFAGGIMSAACDGLRVAEKVAQAYLR